ncbi:hypothetical protein LAD12857_44600 [Lacrimispora amygdalina]|uniref:Uncharacterized protein n=1 Tax=Lacrimispora amygdalina TaxID=253257 RepID=A0ABQ5MCG4_9FIRM
MSFYFLIGTVSWILEIRKNDKKKGNQYLIYFCLYQIFSTIICILTKQIKAGYGAFELVGALTGNILLTEGSILFVFLGVLM